MMNEDNALTNYFGEPGMQAGTQTVRSLLRGLFISQGIIIPQQVIVPDISFYQITADFNQMKRNGAMGVIIRAGQNTWPDPKFATFWRDAKAAGLPRGTYFYYDSRVRPEEQADLFYNQFRGDMPEMEIIADYEEGYGGAYGGWRNLQKFLERLNAKGIPYSKLAIYSGYYYWRSNSPQSDPLELSYFKRFRLHLAWYTSNPSNVSIPAPWSNNDLLFWQYTSSGNGPAYGVGSKGIDLNYFNGTPEQFKARYGGGTIPDPDPEPPEEPTQKGTVLVTALNVRSGPGTNYGIVDGMLRGDVAYGNVDNLTQWMRISRIHRQGGGIDTLDGWASALPQYMQVEPIDNTTPPGGGDMGTIQYENGVVVTTWREFESDCRAIQIPPDAIRSITWWTWGDCRYVEQADGDIVFNATPFNTSTCRPTLGFKVNGNEQHAYVDWNPWVAWNADNTMRLDHPKKVWSQYATAAQFWRYIIEDGVKNPNFNSEWDNINPLRLIGHDERGYTVIISVKGREPGAQRGMSLHEACQIGLDFGCVMMVDGDSGSSVQDYLVIDGQKSLFVGVPAAQRGQVATFGIVKLNQPLVSPPTQPPITEAWLDPITFTVNGIDYRTVGDKIPAEEV